MCTCARNFNTMVNRILAVIKRYMDLFLGGGGVSSG